MLNFSLAQFVAVTLTAAIALTPGTATSAEPTVAPAVSKPAPVVPAPTKSRRVITRATPSPVATPIPKKLGFWERIFGKKKPTPEPATPTPVVKKKPVTKVRKPKPKSISNDPASDTAIDTNASADSEKKGSDSTPPPNTDETPKPSTPKPIKPKKVGDKAQNFPPTTDNADAEEVERQKYDQAKAKAVADPKVQELRGKADGAASEEESRKALRDYNKAMFKRMKEIDPSIKTHVERMEAAVMSRLGE